MAKLALYTIGHSNHEMADFVGLLTMHAVDVVADVRSQPYSRFEHFRREPLEMSLESHGIGYVFLGRELGARRDEVECYENDQVSFDRVAELPAFLGGIARLERGAVDHDIALMCAEREPLDCHRTVLVARHLAGRSIQVRHILADGSIEDHAVTEKRMVEAMGVDPLFDAACSRDELITRAYTERARQIAYRR